MHNVWNDFERQFVFDHVEKLSDEEGARKLSEITGRRISVHSYRKQRHKLGIKKKPGRGVCKVSRTITLEASVAYGLLRTENGDG